jgi:hypothetical protein
MMSDVMMMKNIIALNLQDPISDAVDDVVSFLQLLTGSQEQSSQSKLYKS